MALAPSCCGADLPPHPSLHTAADAMPEQPLVCVCSGGTFLAHDGKRLDTHTGEREKGEHKHTGCVHFPSFGGEHSEAIRTEPPASPANYLQIPHNGRHHHANISPSTLMMTMIGAHHHHHRHHLCRCAGLCRVNAVKDISWLEI